MPPGWTLRGILGTVHILYIKQAKEIKDLAFNIQVFFICIEYKCNRV